MRGTLDMIVPEEFVQISLTIPDGGWNYLTTPNKWPEENHGVAYIALVSSASFYAVSFTSVTSDGTIDMSKVQNGNVYGYLYKGDLTFSFLLDENNFLNLSSTDQLVFYLKDGDGYWIGSGVVCFPGWGYSPDYPKGLLSPGESVTIDANKLTVGSI